MKENIFRADVFEDFSLDLTFYIYIASAILIAFSKCRLKLLLLKMTKTTINWHQWFHEEPSTLVEHFHFTKFYRTFQMFFTQ